MDCPKCKLVNPPSAQRCDCGWDFEAKAVKQSFLHPPPAPPAEVRRRGQRDILFGSLLLAAGLAITVGSIEVARRAGGGQYLIGYGGILYGAFRLARGVDRNRTGLDRAFWGNPFSK